MRLIRRCRAWLRRREANYFRRAGRKHFDRIRESQKGVTR